MGRSKPKKYVLERNYQRVGEFLKAARMKAGLTQREVSRELGYSSPQFISNFEAGIAVPPIKKIVLMEKLYGLDVQKLMEIIFEIEREELKQTKNLR